MVWTSHKSVSLLTGQVKALMCCTLYNSMVVLLLVNFTAGLNANLGLCLLSSTRVESYADLAALRAILYSRFLYNFILMTF